MKKILACIMAILLIAASGLAEGRMILLTQYVQRGMGNRLQIGSLDENGTLRFYETEEFDSIDGADLITLLYEKGRSIGKIDADKLAELKSLAMCVPSQEVEFEFVANDAGSEQSWAVQYGTDGKAIFVLLGGSGDDRYENTDAGAQALYRALRELLPDVRSFDEGMGPEGFQPIPLTEFVGAIPEDTALKVYGRDCEEGLKEIAVTEAEAQDVLRRLRNALVTGKKNCMFVTGGTTIYDLFDAQGEYVRSFEFYEGLLVTDDGMYSVEGF